jgi:trans-2,3-dihydro-3-hydroxyanthranilate isomerase
MRSFRYVVVDVFTDRPLAGNALAVFTDARGLADDQMQGLARELNLSETVFVLPKQGQGQVRLRIFTPARELPFAGHPVLGAAFVIGTSVQLDRIVLETAAGPIAVRLEREAARVVFGWMDQPVPRQIPFDDVPALLAALHVDRSELPVTAYDNGIRHVLVALANPAAVAALRPDLGALARLPDVAVSTFAGQGTRWKTRMFAPAFGIAEDPATG